MPSIFADDTERGHHHLHETIESAHRLLEIGAGYEAVRVLAAIAIHAAETEAGEHATHLLRDLGLSTDEVENATPLSLQSQLREWRRQHSQESTREASERHIANLIRMEDHQLAADRVRDFIANTSTESAHDRWYGFIQRHSLTSLPESPADWASNALAKAFQDWFEFVQLGRAVRLLRTDDPETNEQALMFWHQTIRRMSGHEDDAEDEDSHERQEHRNELAKSLFERAESLARLDPKSAYVLGRLFQLALPASPFAKKSAQWTVENPLSGPNPTHRRSPLKPKQETPLFDELKVRHYQIKLDEDAVRMLREEPKLYVRGTFIAGEESFPNVGIRLKGGWGSFRELDEHSKTAFTIKFNHFENGRRFHGLRRITLNNAVQDPSYLRESIGYSLFRDAGIPAARINYATLSVNDRDYGLYVQVEAINKDFLKRWYHEPGGNLYEGPGDLTNWRELDLDSNQDREDRSDLRHLNHIIETADNDRPWTTLSKEVDLDHFTRFLAMEQLVHHWDGYTQVNNYRIYRNPMTEKFEFLPHGCDQLFEEVHSSVFRPQAGILGRALLQTNEGRQRYRQVVAELLDTVWDEKKLRRRIAKHYKVIRPHLVQQNANPRQLHHFEETVFQVLQFIDLRRSVVQVQLGQQGGQSWRTPTHFEEDHHFFEEHIWH